MRLFNLTDQPLPRQKEALKLTLKKAGIVLKPGDFVDLPKNFSLGQVAGWVHSGWAAVDELPKWYQMEPVPEPKAKKEPEPEEEPEKAIEVDVGAMTATVKAGEDGELGTEDDEVTIKPKTKKAKTKKRGKR